VKRAILALFVVAGCANPNYQLRTGQVVTVEEGAKCFVTIQDPDPIVLAGPSRFEVRCADAARVTPGAMWPPG
jgi:hypothetical protein